MGNCPKAFLLNTRILIILIPHTIFLAVVLARLEEAGDWSWAATFSPLFFFDLVCGLYYLIYLCSYISDRITDTSWDEDSTICFARQKASLFPIILYAVGIVSKVTSEILLILYLEEVAVPFYVSAVFLAVFFATLTIGLFFYSLKPTLQWIILRNN